MTRREAFANLAEKKLKFNGDLRGAMWAYDLLEPLIEAADVLSMCEPLAQETVVVAALNKLDAALGLTADKEEV